MTLLKNEGERTENVTHVCRAGQHDGNGEGRTARQQQIILKFGGNQMNENLRFNNYDELPLVLNITDIQRLMGISRASAYELVRTPGFPAARSGRLIKVSKKAFFDWLEHGGTVDGNGLNHQKGKLIRFPEETDLPPAA